MPYFQRIAAGLVHRFRQQASLLLLLHLQGQQILLSCPPVGHIPCHPAVAAVVHAHYYGIVVFQDAVPLPFLQLLEEGKAPEGGLGDTSVGHQAEASVERRKGHALLLEHVPEGPVGIGFIVIPQPG